MNYLHHGHKYYFTVMISEFILLSVIYWLFFSPDLYSAVAYIASALFYLTAFDFWMYMFKKKQYLYISFPEHFLLTAMPVLFLTLAVYAFIKSSVLLASVYILISFIIIFYYKFRIKKQEETSPFHTMHKNWLLIMISLFLIFDTAVFHLNLMSIQLILYMPVLFTIFTVLYFIYKKDLSFKSLMSVLVFAGIYIISTAFLVLNFTAAGSFTFMLLTHFIMMLSTVFLFKLNAKSSDFDTVYTEKEFFAILFLNIILIFIILNNLACFVQIPVFLNYMLMYTVVFIAYLCFCNYKIILNS